MSLRLDLTGGDKPKPKPKKTKVKDAALEVVKKAQKKDGAEIKEMLRKEAAEKFKVKHKVSVFTDNDNS